MGAQSKISDDVWMVICQTLLAYKGIEATPERRKVIEDKCRVVAFNGGAFVIYRNEIDCFVTEDRRGKWATRSLLDEVIGGVIKEYGQAVCRVHEDNAQSLRFARRLGFSEVGRDGKVIRLEKYEWETLS